METNFAERMIRRRAMNAVGRIPPATTAGFGGAIGSTIVCAIAKTACVAVPVVAFGGIAVAAAKWLFKRHDVSEFVDDLKDFNMDEEEGERYDGGMDGVDVFNERTEPIDHAWGGPPIGGGEEAKRDVECPKCKFAMRAPIDAESDVWSELSCPRCGSGPIVVRRPRQKRYCRGHFNLLRDAIKEFPYRMDHPNRKLAQQQVYTYMLRRSKELRWTVRDQTMLPALAALAFIVHTRGEVDALKLQQSAWAEAEEFEYDLAGSKYPNIRRIFHKLRVFSA